MIPLSSIKNAATQAAIRKQLPGEKTGPIKARAFVRPSTDEDNLNSWERAWLQVLHAKGCYASIRTQAVRLKIGFNTHYTPDFQTTDHKGEVVFWEVKGFFRDDAKVKIKVIARQYSEFKFMLVYKKGAGWITEEVKP